MQIYSYSIPEFNSYYTSIPIYNKDNQIISILKKNRHRILTQLFHMLLRTGMPYCYNAFSIDNKALYKIDCVFTGVRYTLYSNSALKKVAITQKRVQLIEKTQRFTINGDVYRFEKDYTHSGTLTLIIKKLLQ